MLTKPQIWMLKAAQRQAGISDEEYRETLQQFFGVTTSKDPRLGDDSLDVLLAYWEAIYWKGVDAGTLQPPCKGTETFRKRGFWAAKNPSGNTSRDRFTAASVAEEITDLETQLTGLGFDPGYCVAIQRNTMGSGDTLRDLLSYRAALQRTLASKRRKVQKVS